MTTDLDFVGPAKEPSGDTAPQTQEPTSDAGSRDASSLELDGSLTSTATETGSTESKTDGTFTTTSEQDSNVTMQPEDASITDAGALDASHVDAAVDGASPEAGDDDNCLLATNLLAESYEGDLTQWATINWQSTDCQNTDVATDIAADRAHAVRSKINCPSDTDHLHFTSLRLQSETSPTELVGLEAPYGFVLSFSAWLSVGYDFDANKWLDFVRFTGACDRTESPFALGLNDPSRRLSLSNRGSSEVLSEAVADAPRFPLAKWAEVDVYINYTEGSIVVWQDGVLITSSTFQSDYSNLCQLEFGTMASKANSDLVTFQDDVHLSKLEAPLVDTSSSPRTCRE